MQTPKSVPRDLQQNLQNAKYFAARLADATRNEILCGYKRGLLMSYDRILLANSQDCEEAAAKGTLSAAQQRRLSLNANKLKALVAALDALIQAPSPIGRCTLATELTPGLNLYRVSVPLGVLLIIFEGRPEAFVQIASLGIKSGNVCLLKGGSEASRTNRALYSAYVLGVREVFGVKEGEYACDVEGLCSLIQLVESREDVSTLLQMDKCIDLVIPRGGKALVNFVKTHTTIPVLGHADGICHAYVDNDAVSTPERLNTAIEIIRDSKLQYVAACNALEVLLVHKEAANVLLPALGNKLGTEGVSFKADHNAFVLLPKDITELATPQDFSTEWLAPILSVRIVEKLEDAVQEINTNGSHHTDLIISYTPHNVETFMRTVTSADVFCNCSTRFADGFRFGFKAEVGIATGKTHARGPVGMEGLCTYAYRLYGSGHTVQHIEETQTEKGLGGFTHKPLLNYVTQDNSTLVTEDGIDAVESNRLLKM